MLQKSVRLVTSRLGPFADGARVAVVFDEHSHLGPNIFPVTTSIGSAEPSR